MHKKIIHLSTEVTLQPTFLNLSSVVVVQLFFTLQCFLISYVLHLSSGWLVSSSDERPPTLPSNRDLLYILLYIIDFLSLSSASLTNASAVFETPCRFSSPCSSLSWASNLSFFCFASLSFYAVSSSSLPHWTAFSSATFFFCAFSSRFFFCSSRNALYFVCAERVLYHVTGYFNVECLRKCLFHGLL